MTRRSPGDKPLSEPMMVSLLTHVCITKSPWVKGAMILMKFALHGEILFKLWILKKKFNAYFHLVVLLQIRTNHAAFLHAFKCRMQNGSLLCRESYVRRYINRFWSTHLSQFFGQTIDGVLQTSYDWLPRTPIGVKRKLATNYPSKLQWRLTVSSS